MKTKVENKMNNIQYLRGLCALSVFFSHVPCLHISSGQIGVALFMIIGAFFSMYSTDKNPNNVLVKKLIKIIPLYWMLTISVFVITIIKPNLLYSTVGSIGNLIKSLLFIPYDTNNIFGHGPLLNVGWYLEIDIYYMVIFSIFNKFFYEKRLKLSVFFFSFMFIIGRIFNFDHYIFTAYTSYCLIYYVLGLLIYQLYVNKSKLMSALNNKVIPIISTVVFFFIMYFFKHNIFFTLIISMLFIVTLYNDNGYYFKPIVYYGNISFPFYLIHYFVIAFFDRLVFNLNVFNLKTFLCIIVILLITLFLSYIINIFLKKFEKIAKNKLNLVKRSII